MDLINSSTVVVIEYSLGSDLYPVHEVIASEEYLPISGLLQACEEFIFAVPNSAMTIRKKISPFPHLELFLENPADSSNLTIQYYDLHNCSLSAKLELADELPAQWIPSKRAVESFPHILGDNEMGEDESILNGYTLVEKDSEGKTWVEIKETNLTGFLDELVSKLEIDKQIVFKIPIYPLIELQDLEKISFNQMWLVREKV